MANPKIPFNPMFSSEEFSKNPKNMSLEELEILLHSKRLNIKLDMERLEKKINYTKLIFSIVRNTEIGTMLEYLQSV
jgi:hypothetical protein